jgi:arylformamidase
VPCEWIDVSVLLHTGMAHWPDNPPVRIERIKSTDRGDVCNVSAMTLGSHTGTHMDGPLHFVPSGKGLDEMPLDATVGPARVIEIHDAESIKPKELATHRIKSGERVLFKTKNSSRCWRTDDFIEDFVYISREAALALAAAGVRTVGVDYLSVGGYKKDGVETHRALLAAGVWIIEGLDLARVPAGDYELICLPLRVQRSDGAPARAILRPIHGATHR